VLVASGHRTAYIRRRVFDRLRMEIKSGPNTNPEATLRWSGGDNTLGN